jgi:hypothetical protein
VGKFALDKYENETGVFTSRKIVDARTRKLVEQLAERIVDPALHYPIITRRRDLEVVK